METRVAGAPGVSTALGMLAIKVACDLLLGLGTHAIFGDDISALGLCIASALGWIPVLLILALITRELPGGPLLVWRSNRAYRVWVVIAASVAMIAASVGLSFLAGDATTPLEDTIRGRVDLFAMVIYALTVAPLVEEVFFRGYLYGALRNTFGGWLAVLLVGLVFGVFHGLQYAGVPLALAAVTLMGLVTTWVRKHTGALVPCILLHVAYNAVGVAVLGLSYDRW
jgi:membrane protease YdiL (CAAX protease family)